MITKEEANKLIVAAQGSRRHAFSFKSGHSFGAAVLTDGGNIFAGCNVEGVISSLGVCAEMAAVDHAVAHGEYAFKAISVADDNITFPCGACLQYLTQFSQVNDIDLEVVAADGAGNYEVKKLSELLPKKFISKNYDEKIKMFAVKK